jgi:hypothetical protein
VAIDVTDQERSVKVPARVHRRRGLLLLALGAFQLWLWGTRIVNLLGEAGDFSTAFVGIHLALYTAAIGAGIVLGVLGWKQWREGVTAGRP